MRLSFAEQETIITFDRASDTAGLYTADKFWMLKMDRLVKEHPESFAETDAIRIGGKLIAKEYEFPKGLLTIRTHFKKTSSSNAHNFNFKRSDVGQFGSAET